MSLATPPDGGAVGFRHTPYANGHRPLAIGLAPFDPNDWIEVDDRLEVELALKERILAEEGAAAFAALPGAEAAQAEVLEMLAEHLTLRHPQIYRRQGEGIRIRPGDRFVRLAGEEPLLTASRLVQEDLLLMRRDAESWRLAAGSLCFPSSWSLAEKLGRPLEEIHTPVPGFSGQMAARVARIFDQLRIETPLERFNVSIYGDDRLRHAEVRPASLDRFPPDEPILAHAHVRVERQTLRKLARSGAILLTVRVHVDPLEALRRHPLGSTLAMALHRQLGALSPAQLAYKGLSARERLLEALVSLWEPDE